MKPIYIDVPGNPIAKKRPKFARVGTGVKTYNPSDTDEGRFLVYVHTKLGNIIPISGPIRLDLTFIMKRPKGHYGTGRNSGKLKPSAPKYHIIKPDRDNLDKFVMDSLNGYLWHDDCQVVQGSIVKAYHSPTDELGPRTLIKVYAIQDQNKK